MNEPLRYPTDAEIQEAHRALQSSQRRVFFDVWNGIPDAPPVSLSEAQTEAMTYGKIDRRDDPEAAKCELCGKLLRGDRQLKMGVHPDCEDF